MSESGSVRAVRITGPGRYEISHRERPAAEAPLALVAPAFVGLCGTDLDLFDGSMPYYAQGVARYPLQPGHEWSGRLLEGREGLAAGSRVIMDPMVGCGRCDRCAAGRVTHCADRWEMGVRNGLDGALAELVVVPRANLVPIPDGVSLRDAALVEPMVTTLEGIRRADPQAGEEALIVGTGALALVGAMVLTSRGLRTHVLLRNPRRRAAVEASGAIPWLSGTRAAIARFDVVLEAAGTPEAVRAAVGHVAPGGRVALLGVPTLPVELDVAGLVVGDVTSYGVLNGPGQFTPGLELLAAGIVRPEVIIDRVYPFDAFAAALERARQPDRERPKVLLQVDPDVDA